MPRHGNTRNSGRRKHQGHRMHRKTRLARLAANRGRGRGSKSTAWGRSAV
jgi:hypothetical protein